MKKHSNDNDNVHLISPYKILCSNNEVEVAYHRGKIRIISTCDTKLFKLKHNKYWKKIATKSRLFERALRLEPREALIIDDEHVLISFQGKIININVRTGRLYIEHHYRSGMNNPLRFCCANGRILYGEYFGNSNNDSVNIYERMNDKWKQVYSFPKGKINHIHNIVYDEYRQAFWILTGDNDLESGIWLADKNFKNVSPIVKGKQIYRACFLFPIKDGVIYATDTPLEPNGIYCLSEVDGKWCDLKKIYSSPGPCIYGRKIDENSFVIATSVEPDSSLPRAQYRLTKKLGKGVKDNYTHIIRFSNSKVEEIASIKKDMHIPWLFQFGNCCFPNVIDDSQRVYITGQAVKGIDGKTAFIHTT